MDIRADIEGVRSIARTEAALPIAKIGDVREEATNRLAQIAIGQLVHGTVEALLADGSFLVKLPDAAIRTNLPNGSKVGDELQLTLVATAPRPTFSMGGESAAAPTTLSATARLIDTLLQQSNGSSLVGKLPLVSGPGVAPEQVAAALQKTLSNSGLFYESHVQQWASGTRPIADLLREPQNLNPSPSKGAADVAPANHLLALTSQIGADGAHMSGLLSDSPAGRTEPALHPETARLVNLQLNTLEQPRVQWQGEVWPGKKIEWEVSRQSGETHDSASQPGATSDDGRSWQSVVRFDLPTLGRVAATITLIGDHVQVQVRTAKPASAVALRQHVKRFADATGAAGLKLDSLSVKPDEKA